MVRPTLSLLSSELENVEKDVSDVRRDVGELRNSLSSFDTRMSDIRDDQNGFFQKLTWWLGIAGFVIGIQAVSQYARVTDAVDDNAKRTAAAIAEMKEETAKIEKRYRELIDSHEVKSFDAKNGIDTSDFLYGDVTLESTKWDTGPILYSVGVNFAPRFAFEGSTTNKLGAVNVRYSSALIDMLFDKAGGYEFQSYKQGQLQTFDDITAVASQYYTVHISISRNSRDCETVVNIANNLVEAADLGFIDLLPVYQVSTATLTPKSFRLKLTNGATLRTCEELGAPKPSKDQSPSPSETTIRPQ